MLGQILISLFPSGVKFVYILLIKTVKKHFSLYILHIHYIDQVSFFFIINKSGIACINVIFFFCLSYINVKYTYKL